MLQGLLIAVLLLGLFPTVRRFIVRLVGRTAAILMGALLVFVIVVALVQGG